MQPGNAGVLGKMGGTGMVPGRMRGETALRRRLGEAAVNEKRTALFEQFDNPVEAGVGEVGQPGEAQFGRASAEIMANSFQADGRRSEVVGGLPTKRRKYCIHLRQGRRQLLRNGSYSAYDESCFQPPKSGLFSQTFRSSGMVKTIGSKEWFRRAATAVKPPGAEIVST